MISELKKQVFIQNMTYFFSVSGKMEFPNCLEGDLLRTAFNIITEDLHSWLKLKNESE